MALKVSDLGAAMVTAAKKSLAGDWPKAKDYAQSEFKSLAQALADIAKLAAAGKINGRQAKALARIHGNTTQMVLLAVEGLGIIAVENAINSALSVVRDAVNAAAGIRIL